MMNPLRQLLDIFLKPHCWSCKESLANETAKDICSNCWRELYHPEPGGISYEKNSMTTYSAGFYEGPLKKHLSLAKFENEPYSHFILDKVLDIWAEKHIHLFSTPMLIIPIPSHAKRVRQRKTDLPYRYAHRLSRLWKQPMKSDVLSLAGDALPQKELGKHARFLNLQSGFNVSNQLKHTSILLIDDIVTTGATFLAAKATLQKQFPDCKVIGFSLAKTLAIQQN